MDMTVQEWLTLAVNAIAAVAFLGMGWRLHNRILLGVGVAFVVAGVLVAGVPPFASLQARACGTAVGFAASVAGILKLIQLRSGKKYR